MKNLFVILLAVVFCAGFVFAQNTGTINQTGNENEGYITQTGASHNATIDQFGTNFGEVLQYNGDGNKAQITQGSVGNWVHNKTAGGYTEGVWIEQVGSNNEATTSQSKSDGSASTYQLGDNNKASQDMNSTFHYLGSTHNPNIALIVDQEGSYNEGYQRTRFNFGSFGIKKMWIHQINGDYNYANQYSNGGMASVMTVKQDGTGNGNAFSSDVLSTGLNSPLDLPWGTKMNPANSGGIDPVAITNGDFTQYQNGKWSTATIDILGANNKTTQAQEFTVWSLSGQNDATIGIVGDWNSVIQGQMGEYNESYVDIYGDGNVVTTSQEGDNNTANIDLINMSNNNVAAIQQTGNGHNGTIFQDGASNTATIIQQP